MVPFNIILRFKSPFLKVKNSSVKFSINSKSFPLPNNLRSKLSDLSIGISPLILRGVLESFMSKEKSISKIELVNSINPLSNSISLFFIDELLVEISLEKDFLSKS